MGPDEFPTREELGLMIKLIQARINKVSRATGEIMALLKQKGVLTDDDINAFTNRLAESPEAIRLNELSEKVRQFAQVHKTARQYLDPPEE
jgi:hypothetical protein